MATFKQLRIIGKRHRIEWEVPLEDRFGDCDQNGCKIRIAAGLPHDVKRETTLHEVLHAIAMQMNLDVPEEHIRQFSIGLYAVMHDNPKLVGFLTEVEEAGDE